MAVEIDEGEKLTVEIDLSWDGDEAAVDLDANASKATFEIYRDSADAWRWRLVHDNGNIIADGGQGHASKQRAKQGLRSVTKNAVGAPVETVES